ncbi:hypothetical protein IRJ41_021864 [Triplophysa rosa]|uniref:Immunoglobulin domain-containing protein n=1 Tax=Triplophysa rosa TaxID=992332 RepID=A0A9W7WB29_TRIRA|nr:hypothetical protein IRJ41_021864 [Triplophysa rosa]
MNHLLVSLVLMHLAAGVFGADDVVRLSVMEGDSVPLHIKPDEIQGAEKVLWTFNGDEKHIAWIDKEKNTSSVPENGREIFRDRLKLNNQTGDLTITNITSQHSGLYQLEIRASSKISYKRFNVTVSAITEPDQRSHWVITGPLLTVALMLLGGFFIIYKRCKNKRSSDEDKETDVPLK